MSIKIIFGDSYSHLDEIILDIARRLKRELGAIVVKVETRKEENGRYLRVFVFDDSEEVIDKIMKIIYDELEKNNMLGEIIPEVVKISDEENE